MGAVRALAVSSSGDGLLFATDNSGVLNKWDLREGRLIARWTTEQIPIRAMACSGAGLLAVAGSDVEIWRTDVGEKLFNIGGHQRPVNTLSLSQDGRFLTSGGDDQKVATWDLREIRLQLETLGLAW